jgi:hypothetical protein
MAHLLLHAAGAMASRTLRLLQLHDVALLSRRMTAADWAECLGSGAGVDGSWWAWPPLRLTARYYPATIPAAILTGLKPACPRLLAMLMQHRTLSDVSLSALRIEAFPGIEWSRSAVEAARYVVNRALPNREVRELRTQLERSRISAAATRWNQLSQGRRMLLWMAARQMRAETLYPVRMALRETREPPPGATG